MTLFRTNRDIWDCAAEGRLVNLQQHIRARVSIRRSQKSAGVDEKCPWTGLSALHYACYNGRLKAAKMLLEHGARLNLVTDDGTRRTALHLACENGHYKLSRFLLELYESTKEFSNDADGNSVVHAACKSGNLSLVRFIFEKYGATKLSELVEPGEFEEEIDDFLEEQFQKVDVWRP